MATLSEKSGINSIEDFLKAINFTTLREQKNAITEACIALMAIGGEENEKTAEQLDGLLAFLDSFQDMAVDVYGIDEKVVFNFTDEDETEGDEEIKKEDKAIDDLEKDLWNSPTGTPDIP